MGKKLACFLILGLGRIVGSLVAYLLLSALLAVLGFSAMGHTGAFEQEARQKGWYPAPKKSRPDEVNKFDDARFAIRFPAQSDPVP